MEEDRTVDDVGECSAMETTAAGSAGRGGVRLRCGARHPALQRGAVEECGAQLALDGRFPPVVFAFFPIDSLSIAAQVRTVLHKWTTGYVGQQRL